MFAASPIALQSWCKREPNEPIPMYGHSSAQCQSVFLKIQDRQRVKKRQNSDCRVRIICHRGIADGSDGARALWHSHSARTEMFFADAPDWPSPDLPPPDWPAPDWPPPDWPAPGWPPPPCTAPLPVNLGHQLHPNHVRSPLYKTLLYRLHFVPQVHFWVPSILASKCLSKLTWWWPSSVSLGSHNHGLHVYLLVHLIMPFICISKLAQSCPLSASLSSLDLGQQVLLHTCSITTTKCISDVTG